MKISTILDKVDENQLFVPAFQREYVWKRENAKQLIESLIKEYPTGTMLTWETANPPELKGPHRYDERQGAVRILLDGQQRITTLYMLIRNRIPPYYSSAEIANDTRGLYVHLETLELSYYSRARMQNNPLWQNVSDIFQHKIRARDIVRILESSGEEISRERDDAIDDNTRRLERILDYDFPEQTIPVKASIREAIDIFYRVNAGGVSLTDAELALAQISGYWPQARDLFKAKLAELASSGFVLKLDFIVYALLGCLYHQGSEMQKLHDPENNEQLRAAWEKLDRRVLDYVVNILRSNCFVDHTYEINSIYALIPMIVYCFDQMPHHPNDEQIRKMVKWFYYSQIRARYSSQLPSKLDRDLREIQESKQPFDNLLGIIEEEQGRLDIVPSEFAGRAIQHPLFSMMRWYFKSRAAVCLTTGLGLRRNMGSNYQLENDHIFPYSELKGRGYGEGNRVKYALAQELTNRVILTQVANRTKSDTLAEDYLTGVNARFPGALAKQCIPEDVELWKMDHYEEFLEKRREMLANELNAFLQSITATEQGNGQKISLEEMIAELENDGLEFKSTLRWNLQEGIVDKRLEDAVVKTVVAFGNSSGGILLIGVDNEGNILGLDNDYASLDADRDKFELHLRNILRAEIGLPFISEKVRVSFPVIRGAEICRVDVSPAKEPLILRVKNRDGLTVEKLYVRNGNASQEMNLGEMMPYVRERFYA